MKCAWGMWWTVTGGWGERTTVGVLGNPNTIILNHPGAVPSASGKKGPARSQEFLQRTASSLSTSMGAEGGVTKSEMCLTRQTATGMSHPNQGAGKKTT